jgi:hypothetical protein
MANTDIIRRRARSAYEMGRMRRALVRALPVPMLALVSLLGSHQHMLTVAVAAIAAASIIVFEQLGGDVGAGAHRGFLFGLVPFAASMATRPLGHIEAFGMCFHGCVAVCAAASTVMMLFLVYAARQRTQAGPYVLGGGWIILTIGATACSCVGIAGIAVLVGLVALLAFPAFAISARLTRSA